MTCPRVFSWKEIETILNPGLPGYWYAYQEVNSSKQLGLQRHKLFWIVLRLPVYIKEELMLKRKFTSKKVLNELEWVTRYSVQLLLSCVQLFATPWMAACQASLSINNSQSLLKLMPIELVMPSNHLILCHPLLLPHSIFPSIRVFSNESVLWIRWPKCWEFQLQHQSF